MTNKIEQKIDGDENFQQSVGTQNITIISQGVSKEEAREISAEMSRKVSNEYFQLSQDLANKRMDSFENTIVERLSQLENGLNSFQNPDFVLSYRKAQIQAATTDDNEAYKMLAELLIHRHNNSNDGYKKTGVDGAIEIVNQLSDASLTALTILACIELSILPADNRLDDGLSVLNDCFASILKNGLPANNDWLDQLDILKAVRVNPISSFKKFDEIMFDRMPGYSTAGIKKDSDEYNKATEIQNKYHMTILVDNPLNHEFVIIPMFSRNQLKKFKKFGMGFSVPFSESDIKCCEELLNLYSKDTKEITNVKKILIDKIDSYSSFKNIHDWWDKIPKACELTIIGRVLGHANAKKCYSGFPDLD